MEFSFILVEPNHPENIGATARALKTMGFPDLRLVNPCNHLSERAVWMAYASFEILENAKVFQSLKEATSDLDLLIATSVRRRHLHYEYRHPNQLIELIQSKKDIVQRIGVIFGREDNGLTNDEIKQCDIISSIPLNCSYPSLNLSQAVMIYAYSLSPLVIPSRQEQKMQKSDSQYQVLKEKMHRIFDWIDIPPDNTALDRLKKRMNFLEYEDIQLLHFICDRILEKVKTAKEECKC